MLAMCSRFGCLPSQLMAEDTELLRLLTIEGLAKDREEEGPGGE